MDPHASTIPGTPKARATALLVLALATLAGCAGGGPLAERGTMIGTLRSNVAQLETEKYQLQKDLGQVRAAQRDLEDRLVREEAENQVLARRLDDLRQASRDDGLSLGSGPLNLSTGSASDPFESEPQRHATPASQPRGRKVPFAQIPGQIRPLPDDRNGFSTPPAEDQFNGSELFPNADDVSRLDDFRAARTPWLPVARGLGGSGTRFR